jgi:hypothetical protein
MSDDGKDADADADAAVTAAAIKYQLVQHHIQLWKPPYYGVHDSNVQLERLSEQPMFVSVISGSTSTSTSASTSVSVSAPTPTPNQHSNKNKNNCVLQHLKDFQSHALQKLRAKGKVLDTVTLQILFGRDSGSVGSVSVGVGSVGAESVGVGVGEAQSRLAVPQLPMDFNVTRSWAETVQVVRVMDDEDVTPSSSSSLILRLTLQRLNPDLLVADFLSQLETELCGTIRLIHKGKALLSIDSASASARLSERLSGDANASANVLCLVQREQTTIAPSESEQPQGNDDDDEVLISSIRTAAATLQNSTSSMLNIDITDSNGNLVPMRPADRVAFLTALGLHSIGRDRMKKDRHNVQSALVFLLQADQEWGLLENANSWREKVDNYGLLQLDIAWVYLKCSNDLEHLPDVLQRLETAETVLRSQVHTNFVPLALCCADLGNPVPALAAIFVRLFLLQGVAQHFNGETTKSKERLDWAWALAKSLRNVSLPEVVSRLCQAISVKPETAISALRRTNGNGDEAAAIIQQDETKLITAEKKQRKQRRLGLCENGKDHVDLQLLRQLQTVLGLPSDDDDDDDGNNNNDNNDAGQSVAGGLLRLTNNNLEEALDMYRDRDNTALLGRITDLDQSQGKPRHNEVRIRRIQQIDEMALVSLISMGVDDASAREALTCNENNLEEALLWLTTTTQETSNSMSESDDEDDDEEAIQEEAEDTEQEEAIDLLERVLGETLQEQHNGNDEYLGNSLDEEWGYIEHYRGRTA